MRVFLDRLYLFSGYAAGVFLVVPGHLRPDDVALGRASGGLQHPGRR